MSSKRNIKRNVLITVGVGLVATAVIVGTVVGLKGKSSGSSKSSTLRGKNVSNVVDSPDTCAARYRCGRLCCTAAEKCVNSASSAQAVTSDGVWEPLETFSSCVPRDSGPSPTPAPTPAPAPVNTNVPANATAEAVLLPGDVVLSFAAPLKQPDYYYRCAAGQFLTKAALRYADSITAVTRFACSGSEDVLPTAFADSTGGTAATATLPADTTEFVNSFCNLQGRGAFFSATEEWRVTSLNFLLCNGMVLAEGVGPYADQEPGRDPAITVRALEPLQCGIAQRVVGLAVTVKEPPVPGSEAVTGLSVICGGCSAGMAGTDCGTMCPANTYATAGTFNDCTPCPAGSISTAGSIACVAPAGFVPPEIRVPGIIEAEHFVAGAQGAAYYNSPKGEPDTALNNRLRLAEVTVTSLDDKQPQLNEFVVGWTGPGEWMQYKVTATETAQVFASYRVARGLRAGAPCGISILVDAPMTADPADMCTTKANKHMGTWYDGDFSTATWQKYRYVGLYNAPFMLTAGEHTITLCVDAGDMNIDKFRLSQLADPTCETGKIGIKRAEPQVSSAGSGYCDIALCFPLSCEKFDISPVCDSATPAECCGATIAAGITNKNDFDVSCEAFAPPCVMQRAIEPNLCDPNPCQQGARCGIEYASTRAECAQKAVCDCTQGFAGQFCETACNAGEHACGSGVVGYDSTASIPDSVCCKSATEECLPIAGKYGSSSACVPLQRPRKCAECLNGSECRIINYYGPGDILECVCAGTFTGVFCETAP